MTPDEHAARAESLLADAEEIYATITHAVDNEGKSVAEMRPDIAEIGVIATLAQVHATLSLRQAKDPAPEPAPPSHLLGRHKVARPANPVGHEPTNEGTPQESPPTWRMPPPKDRTGEIDKG